MSGVPLNLISSICSFQARCSKTSALGQKVAFIKTKVNQMEMSFIYSSIQKNTVAIRNIPGVDNGNDIMASNGLSQGIGMSPQSIFRYITNSAMVDDT